ncbi:MAG TPA: hypothetical protein DCY14_15380 [Anaerolineae bacterium]|nr:hypothetical protein [Anaerolineae bacterium]
MIGKSQQNGRCSGVLYEADCQGTRFTNDFSNHPPAEADDEIQEWSGGNRQHTGSHPIPNHAQATVIITKQSAPMIKCQSQQE